ncbi:MAG: protein kinase [Elusimicrobia bacterium]|nr:protein kinase [Elusimicrobiota bacterium]
MAKKNIKEEKYEEATKYYDEEIYKGRKDPRTFAMGAFSAFNSGDIEKAHAWSGRVLEEDPTGPFASMARSINKLTANKMDDFKPGKGADLPPPEEAREAESFLPAEHARPPASERRQPGESVVPSAVTLAGSFAEESRTALKVGDFVRAVQKADLAIKADPEDSRARHLRSVSLVRLRRYAEAKEEAERALDLAHGNPPLLLVHGLAAGRIGDYEAAKRDAEQALSQKPQHPAALRLLAFAQAGLKDRAGMLDTFKRAGLRPPPDDQDASLLFSDAFLLTGRAAEERSLNRGRRPKGLVIGAASLGAAALVGGLIMAFGRRGKEEERAPAWRTPTPRPAYAEDPAVIGPYRLIGTLGTGGMGIVYKAQDGQLERLVALKRMRDEIAADPRERERFIKEARIVSALDHPGIVRIHTIHEAPQGTFLVFEHVEGRTLSDILGERGALPFAEARGLISQACDAVAYAHSKGVIHRDLKPSNIMVDAAGRVRVMDFGIARAMKDALDRLTQATASGTPPYMAPEQEEGRAAPASDVYALAVCLYEMLSGEPPFAGAGMALYQAKREGRFPPLGPRLGPATPAGLDELLARALQPDPARRLGSPRELASALGAVPA